MTSRPSSCTAFCGPRRLTSGSLIEAALAARALINKDPDAQVILFDDTTGQAIDADLRGAPQDVARRLDERFGPAADPKAPARRGRPRLGVIPREVTLLPRHWDWLAAQPGGPSVALRKLVEEARRGDEAPGRTRAAQEAAYRFMSAMAGDAPGFEEAARSLFAGDREGFEARIGGWPQDVRDHALTLASPGLG